MTDIPFTNFSEGLSYTASLSEGDTIKTNQDSAQIKSSTSTDNSADSNINVINPSPDLLHPIHILPEEPSQVPTREISISSTSSG